MLRAQLRWAVVHDMRERTRLLVAHGTDFRTPFPDGRTAAELAASCGNQAIVDGLVAAGATPPTLAPVDAFVAAALRADRDEIDRLRAAHPGVVDAAHAARPGLVVQAAAQRRVDAVPLLVELGFDVNARSRADLPVEEERETALHVAAGDGDVTLARRLLALGADPTVHDHRFDATPLGWARHAEHVEMVELLAPLTPGE
jgi:ankyrin repeat protein